MAVVDHLRELRGRMIRSLLFLVLAFAVALFFFDPLLDLVARAVQPGPDHRSATTPRRRRTSPGATGPLLLQLKLCGVAAVMVSSPFWLYQMWAFVGARPAAARAAVDQGLRR